MVKRDLIEIRNLTKKFGNGQPYTGFKLRMPEIKVRVRGQIRAISRIGK